MYPVWQFLKITFEHLPINHAEEQACLLIVNGIIIDICSVSNQTYAPAVEDRLVVTRNNLGNGYIVTALHHTTSDTRGIDGWMISGNKEYADEEACLMSTTDVVKFVICREDSLKYQTFLFSEAFLSKLCTILNRLHDGLLGIPVAEFIFGNLVRVDINGILHPLMLKNLCGDSRLARTVWPGNNDEYRFMNSGYHAAIIFWASCRIRSKKRLVASSFVRLAASAASFISWERTASEGSSMLVKRYVSIVGFIITSSMISVTKVQNKSHTQ